MLFLISKIYFCLDALFCSFSPETLWTVFSTRRAGLTTRSAPRQGGTSSFRFACVSRGWFVLCAQDCFTSRPSFLNHSLPGRVTIKGKYNLCHFLDLFCCVTHVLVGWRRKAITNCVTSWPSCWANLLLAVWQKLQMQTVPFLGLRNCVIVLCLFQEKVCRDMEIVALVKKDVLKQNVFSLQTKKGE